MPVLPTSCPAGSSEQARPRRSCNRPEQRLLHWRRGKQVVQALFPSLLSGLYVEDQLTVSEDRIQRCPRLLPQILSPVWGKHSLGQASPSSLRPSTSPSSTRSALASGRSPSYPEAPGPRAEFLPGLLDLGSGPPTTVSTGSPYNGTRCPGQGCPHQNPSLSGISVIPALRGLRQEKCCEFKDSLCFIG